MTAKPTEKHKQIADASSPPARFMLDFLAFLFILSTPYLVFVDDKAFVFEIVNLYFILFFSVIAIILSLILRVAPFALLRVLILTALLLLYIDFQFDWLQWWGVRLGAVTIALFLTLWVLRANASRILTAMFGTMIVVTLASTPLASLLQTGVGQPSEEVGNNAGLPIYVHVILDEHIGIEGLENDVPSHQVIKSKILDFFSTHGFRVFGRAYSQYTDSEDAIFTTLNLASSTAMQTLYSRKDHGFTLSKNPYFDYILSKGYLINIYQSNYLDFCNSVETGIQKCNTYVHHGVSSSVLAELTDDKKAKMVSTVYGELSFFRRESRKYYEKLRKYIAESGVEFPAWVDSTGTLGPIPALPVFDTLIEDVSTAPEGTMFFAHISIPHHPYSVDSMCQIRSPVMDWVTRYKDKQNSELDNSPQSRQIRYVEYFRQIDCAFLKLEKLLAAIESRGKLADAVILVQGDHGSRLGLVSPRLSKIDRLSQRDYYDAFSTLYALKSPDVDPGYDTRMLALPELLRITVAGDINASADTGTAVAPSVFIRGRAKKDPAKVRFQEVPMPYLPITNQ